VILKTVVFAVVSLVAIITLTSVITDAVKVVGQVPENSQNLNAG
jgi:hypothetical protein